MLDQQFRKIWLVDFGAVQNQAAVINHSFTVVGTVGYAPLEQFWGRAIAASDLYALGATLVHLLTGVAPADLPQRNLRIQFRDRTTVNSRLIRWVEKLTEPAFERRFDRAQDALTALEQAKPKPKPKPKPLSVSHQIQKSQTSLDFTSIAWCCLQCCYFTLGAGMMTYSAANYYSAVNFKYNAVSTVGEISQTIAETTYAQSTYTRIPVTSHVSTVQFNTSQGKPMTFTVKSACRVNSDPYACDGKAVQVFYDPDDPKLAMIKGGPSPLTKVATSFVWGLFFMFVGIIGSCESATSSPSNRKK